MLVANPAKSKSSNLHLEQDILVEKHNMRLFVPLVKYKHNLCLLGCRSKFRENGR